MGGALTCHAATWYWAAKEAQALGLSAVKTDLVMLGNVAAMVPKASMLGLIGPGRSANWDFAITPNTPLDGSVLIWPLGGHIPPLSVVSMQFQVITNRCSSQESA